MLNIGFIKSDKKNEQRRALLPNDIEKIKNKEYLYFEKVIANILSLDVKSVIKASY